LEIWVRERQREEAGGIQVLDLKNTLSCSMPNVHCLEGPRMVWTAFMFRNRNYSHLPGREEGEREEKREGRGKEEGLKGFWVFQASQQY
jgi:hypothetical protein